MFPERLPERVRATSLAMMHETVMTVTMSRWSTPPVRRHRGPRVDKLRSARADRHRGGFAVRQRAELHPEGRQRAVDDPEERGGVLGEVRLALLRRQQNATKPHAANTVITSADVFAPNA